MPDEEQTSSESEPQTAAPSGDASPASDTDSQAEVGPPPAPINQDLTLSMKVDTMPDDNERPASQDKPVTPPPSPQNVDTTRGTDAPTATPSPAPKNIYLTEDVKVPVQKEAQDSGDSGADK